MERQPNWIFFPLENAMLSCSDKLTSRNEQNPELLLGGRILLCDSVAKLYKTQQKERGNHTLIHEEEVASNLIPLDTKMKDTVPSVL
jgi:hypothetical protein